MLLAPRFTPETRLLDRPPKNLLPAIVIVTGDILEPVAALKPDTTGAGTTIVYGVDAVGLSGRPPSVAYATTVELVVSVNGAAYMVEELLGVVPSVVYLMVAPPVLVEIVTVTELL